MRQLEDEVETTTDRIERNGSRGSRVFVDWKNTNRHPRHRNGVQHGVGEGADHNKSGARIQRK
jgi:hypothetical protein